MSAAYWVISGPGLPVGARLTGAMGPAASDALTWLDVCVLGQHLPQMYRTTEIRKLTAEDCTDLGLCPDCFGFGDLGPDVQDMLALARNINEIQLPCAGCGGSGRPAVRVSVSRDGRGGVMGSIRPIAHRYVPPRPDSDPQLMAAFEVPPDMCLACGMAQDGTGPRGEALHASDS